MSSSYGDSLSMTELFFRHRRMLLAALFVSAAILYGARVGKPFTSDMEAALAQYGMYGRNYVKYGYLRSGFAPISAAGPLEHYPSVTEQIYSHRPPTVSVLVTLSYQVFGVSESALRIPVILAALATLALFLALAERLLGPGWGLVAAALFAFVPIYSYYAVTTVHQVFGLLGCLLIFLAGLRWMERSERRRLVELVAATGVGCWLDWPAYYAAGAVGLLLVLRGRPLWRGGVAVWLAAIGSFVLFLGYLWLLDPKEGLPLLHLKGSGSGQGGQAPASIFHYLGREGRELAVHFTLPLLILAGVGASQLRPRQNPAHQVILSLLLLGTDEVIFPNMSWWHDYLTLPLAPFAALAAALALKGLMASAPRRLAAGLLTAGFLVQTGLVLHKRLTFVGSNEVSVALAAELSRRTSSTDRSLVRVKHDVHLRAFYADRTVVTYVEPQEALSRMYVNASERGVNDQELIRRLSGPDHGFRWFVTAEADAAAERLAWIRGLRGRPDFEEFVRLSFWLETPSKPTELLTFLRSRFPSTVEGGFLFFDLSSALPPPSKEK
jgi:hypothetical protein